MPGLPLAHSKKKHSAWWETQIGGITDELRRYLVARYRALHEWHDDLISESLLDLTRQLRERRQQYPRAWYGEDPPSKKHRDYLHKLAITILRRRVADRFRDPLSAWARSVSLEELTHVAAEAPADPVRHLTALRVLQVCVAVMANASDQERALIRRLTDGDTARAWTAAERQRLHRLRARLTKAIRTQLGESVAGLLQEDR